MDVNAVVLNGTVNYSKSGNQKFLQKNNDPASANILSYTNIILSGSGAKTSPDSLTINVSGIFSIQGISTFLLGTLSAINYGSNGTLEYADTNAHVIASTSYEWPSANGPVNLLMNNSKGTSLTVTRTISGTLNLVSGNFNSNNQLTINSSGSLKYLGGTTSNFILPSCLTNFKPYTGTTNLLGNLTINGTLDLGNNTLNIASNTLYLNGDFTTQNGVIKSNGSGSINVGGTGDLTNFLLFDQTLSGTTNRLNNFFLNRGTSVVSGSITLPSFSPFNPLSIKSIYSGELRMPFDQSSR